MEKIKSVKFSTYSNNGFTFIELLIVTAIIAILASIALMQYINVKANAIESTMLSDALNCVSKVESWYANMNTYSGFNNSECVVSKGNSLTISNLTSTTYTITVSNPSARSGRTTCKIDNTGTISWE
ncbi:MAG: prepilin-type N-terminal cleavage/methylation domain-containing protein [Candidatus Micrarchaeia archaeon]